MATNFATANTGAATATTVSITIPAAAAVGDVMIVFFSVWTGTTTVDTPTFSRNTWTKLDSLLNGGSTGNTQTWWTTVATGDPGATLTLTWTTLGRMGVVCWTTTGTGINTHAVNASSATSSTTSEAAPTLTGVQSTDLVVIGFGAEGDQGGTMTLTPPGGTWTEHGNAVSTSGAGRNGGVTVNDKTNGTDTPTATASRAAFWAIGSVAVTTATTPRPVPPIRKALQAANRSFTY